MLAESKWSGRGGGGTHFVLKERQLREITVIIATTWEGRRENADMRVGVPVIEPAVVEWNDPQA